MYHLLIVDDNSATLRLIKTMLQDEYEITLVTSGTRALNAIKKQQPDLILLDVLMPETDGFDTYKEIRAYEETTSSTNIPVIFLTSENDSETERRGLKLGASDFIPKPINKDILKKRIQNAINNSKAIENLTKEATTDEMTGFFNKAYGTKETAEVCRNSTGALAVLDLDNFKLVNDLHGHEAGDKILKAFSKIMKSAIRESDVVSRIGGDEFLVFFRGITDEAAFATLSKRLNRQLRSKMEQILGEDNGVPLGVSMGIVIVPRHGRTFEELFEKADSSLYSVKQNGKHGFHVYSNTDGQQADLKDAGASEQEMMRIMKVIEERGGNKEALILNDESFSMIYHYIMRFHIRYGGYLTRILITLREKSDNADMQEISLQYGQMLQKKLRNSDLVLRRRINQYFVLLTERAEIESQTVISRLKSAWAKSGYQDDADVEFYMEYQQLEPEKKNKDYKK